jgi:hypothetical protein
MHLTQDQLVICQTLSLMLLNSLIKEQNELLEQDGDNDLLLYHYQAQIDKINDHLDELGFY